MEFPVSINVKSVNVGSLGNPKSVQIVGHDIFVEANVLPKCKAVLKLITSLCVLCGSTWLKVHYIFMIIFKQISQNIWRIT